MQRILRSSLIVAVVVALSAGAAGSQSSGVAMSNPLGPWTIAPYSSTVSRGTVGPATLVGGKGYGFLALTAIPDKAERRRMQVTTGIRFLSVHSVDCNAVVYKVSYTDGITSVQKKLAVATPNFFNLVPVLKEDKVSRAVWERKGFADEAVDMSTGRIYASACFFPDVPLQVQDSIIKVFADTIIQRERTGFLILSGAQSLNELAELAEVELVTERAMCGEVCINTARKTTGIDSTQGFDISAIDFPPTDTTVWYPDSALTGEGIWVGLYDCIVDSTILDFREWDYTQAYLPGLPRDTLVKRSKLRIVPDTTRGDRYTVGSDMGQFLKYQ